MQNYKYLMEYIRGNKLSIILSIIFANIAAIFSTLNPVVIKYAIDIVIGKEKIKSGEYLMKLVDSAMNFKHFSNGIILIGCVIVSFTVLQGLFLYFKDRLATRVAQKSSKRIREELFKKIEYLPYDFHVNSQGGDIVQRCTSDVETVQGFVSEQLAVLGQVVFTVIYVITIMCMINVKYTLISVILIPVIFGYTLNFFTKMQKVFREADETEGKLTNVVQESLTGIRVVRAFAAEKIELDRFDEQNREYKRKIYELIKLMSRFWSLSDFLCLGQFSIVIVSGVYLASYNIVTVGTVIAFSSFAGMMIWPIRQFGQIAASIGEAFVSLKRINEILEKKSETYNENDERPVIEGDIEIKNLTFSYPNGQKILDDISLSIKKGQTIALMGTTGCGKSTIAHILLRLYEYDIGSIKLDGEELSKIDRKWVRENISIVLQEPYLFSRNIEENIKMGKENAKNEEIEKFAKIAYIHDSIKKFKDSYKTMVGEKGITLSGGQKQRLAIARALIKKSPILIFDDSLSALDADTDSKIRRSLKDDNNNRTTIIISHRITSVIDCDMIFVLENGKIAEKGKHIELINKKQGIYKNIYEIQSRPVDEEELA